MALVVGVELVWLQEMIKRAAVIAGMGLAVACRHVISLELSLGRLACPPVEGFPIEHAS